MLVPVLVKYRFFIELILPYIYLISHSILGCIMCRSGCLFRRFTSSYSVTRHPLLKWIKQYGRCAIGSHFSNSRLQTKLFTLKTPEDYCYWVHIMQRDVITPVGNTLRPIIGSFKSNLITRPPSCLGCMKIQKLCKFCLTQTKHFLHSNSTPATVWPNKTKYAAILYRLSLS